MEHCDTSKGIIEIALCTSNISLHTGCSLIPVQILLLTIWRQSKMDVISESIEVLYFHWDEEMTIATYLSY